MKLNEVFKPIFERGDTEGGYSNVMTEKENEVIIKYWDAIVKVADSDTAVIRGMEPTGSLIVGDGSRMNRKSRNTRNFYTLILDNDPRWASYPKRSQSFICTSGSNYNHYGRPYVVVPLENQDFGVCPDMDFWLSFKRFFPKEMNDNLEQLARELEIKVSDESFDEFKASMIKIGEKITSFGSNLPIDVKTKLAPIQEVGYDLGDNFYEWFAQLFDPETNGFYVTNDINDVKQHREAWVSGKVLFIEYEELWPKIFRMVIKGDKPQ